ncbi:hypothetical protein PORY_002437 [Pneumocystis oryctolagi]|uniref:Uncharacterized protein n=1 Tax=Pneumocystis oryctolagi TaxID=42067 RepID=A0ACB7C9P9_9ASCO|nr:hypothetical protein PORY_002437 [Pneumocystis oryctolagi]
MKSSIFVVFSLVVPPFMKNNEFIYEKIISLNSMNLKILVLAIFVYSIKPKNLHLLLENLCGERKKKCQSLKTGIDKKCNELKNILNYALKKNVYFLKEYVQLAFQEYVVFYEVNKRDDITLEILLRTLNKGSLKNSNMTECEMGLRGLIKKCFYLETTYSYLLTLAKTKCSSLNEEIRKILNTITNEKYLSLLEQYYFFNLNCADNNKPDCDRVVKKCKKRSVFYASLGHFLT